MRSLIALLLVAGYAVAAPAPLYKFKPILPGDTIRVGSIFRYGPDLLRTYDLKGDLFFCEKYPSGDRNWSPNLHAPAIHGCCYGPGYCIPRNTLTDDQIKEAIKKYKQTDK